MLEFSSQSQIFMDFNNSWFVFSRDLLPRQPRKQGFKKLFEPKTQMFSELSAG